MLRSRNKLLILLVLLLISFNFLSVGKSLAFKDIKGHWAERELLEMIEKDLMHGFEGEMRPDDNLTRAEMSAVLNRILNPSYKVDINGYKDVKKTDWYYDDMQKIVGMNILEGYEQKLHPQLAITREETFTAISRAFKLDSKYVGGDVKTNLKDIDKISDWAKTSTYGLLKKAYIQGDDELELKPRNNITRAEFAKLISNIIDTYINRENINNKESEGNILLNGERLKLKNSTIDGNVVLADGIVNEEILLDNVDISGRLIVRSDVNLNIRNSNITELVIVDGKKNMKIGLDKDSHIDNLIIERVVNLSGDGFINSIYIDNLGKGTKILLDNTKVTNDEGCYIYDKSNKKLFELDNEYINLTEGMKKLIKEVEQIAERNSIIKDQNGNILKIEVNKDKGILMIDRDFNIQKVDKTKLLAEELKNAKYFEGYYTLSDNEKVKLKDKDYKTSKNIIINDFLRSLSNVENLVEKETVEIKVFGNHDSEVVLYSVDVILK